MDEAVGSSPRSKASHAEWLSTAASAGRGEAERATKLSGDQSWTASSAFAFQGGQRLVQQLSTAITGNDGSRVGAIPFEFARQQSCWRWLLCSVQPLADAIAVQRNLFQGDVAPLLIWLCNSAAV